MSTDNKKKWYKTWWGVIAIIFLFPIFLMYFASRFIWQQKWEKKYRVGAIIALWAVVLIGGFVNDAQKPKLQPVTSQGSCIGPDGKQIGLSPDDCVKFNNAWKDQQQGTTSNNATQPTVAPTSTPKPVETYEIVVTSQIVKKVNGKHRYFFDIRNKDTKPFEGSVTISLFTSKLSNPIAGDTFNTTKAIEPGLGTSVFTDANTGPQSVHGENGITKFKYVVKKGDKTVKSGEGAITEKFEDTDL